jgi:predicted CopG family antitoxin
MTASHLTTIALSRENYAILKSLGKTGDSFNDVLTELLKGLGEGENDKEE